VLVRNEPPPLLFIGLSTGAKRSETPQGWLLGPIISTMWRPGTSRPKVGSTDPTVSRPPGGPTQVCFLGVVVLWALRSVPGVHMLLRRFRFSRGPMDPCVHVSHSDSSGLASLGLMTWLACMAPEVAATPWLR
jgi:hypothetical protein